MILTQPYGVDYLGSYGPGGQSYADIGLKAGHNGWDLSAPTGAAVLACMDGDMTYTPGTTGYGNNIRLRNKELGLEIVYGHLLYLIGSNNRQVKAGELIARGNNTGFSTGPHLHLGVRHIYWQNGAGPFVRDAGNVMFGYIDPTPLFAPDVFDLPVDKQYGLTPLTPGVPSETEWYEKSEWVFKNLKRLLSTREMKALRYGFWDLRTVLDPAMFQVWSEMHKPEAQKRGIVR